MQKRARVVFLFTLAFIGLSHSIAKAQCIMINEIMINPDGPNDGFNMPNTAEWVELYNACDYPVDLSCFVFTDGDFTVTIPSGTFIPAEGFLTAGSNNSGFPVDLNWATCGCTTNTDDVGIFSNNGEQWVLVDDQGNLINGVYWGGGQFPVDISSAATVGCNSQDIYFNNAVPGIELLPLSGGQDCSISRLCTGEWTETCDSDITPGEQNATETITVSLSTPDNEICAGSCINFSDESQGALTWDWTFTGATNSSSTDENPQNICYDVPGVYGVELSINTSCGQFSAYYPGMITVLDNNIPEISPSNPAALCSGESVTLTSSVAGDLQWYRNGTVLIGENDVTLTVSQSGSYAVEYTNGECIAMSATVDVAVLQTDIPEVIPDGSLELCSPATVSLDCSGSYDNYQWLLNDVEIIGANSPSLTASSGGTYSLIVTNGSCEASSEPITVTVIEPFLSEIVEQGPIEACQNEDVTLTAAQLSESYQWLLNDVEIPGATSSQLTAIDAGFYSLITTQNGCPGEPESIEVVLLTVPEVSIDPAEGINSCLSAGLLEATTNGNVQWFLNGVAIPNANDELLPVTENGEYYFISALNDQCPQLSATVEVSLNETLETILLATADTACVGEIVVITATGNFDSIVWNNGQTSSAIEVNQSGDYIATTQLGDCHATDTVSVTFLEYPVVDAGKDFFSPCSENLIIPGKSDSIAFWQMNGVFIALGDTAVVPNPVKDTEYVLISENGSCISMDTVQVFVDCIFIFAPNSFTPNEDGLNDVFRVYVEGVQQYTLRIYNRWGDLMFETTNPDDVWTGGSPDYYVPDGIYTWQIEALDATKNMLLDKDHSTGFVIVLR